MLVVQKAWHASIVIAVVVLYDEPVSARPEISSAQPRYCHEPIVCPAVSVPVQVGGEELVDVLDVVTLEIGVTNH